MLHALSVSKKLGNTFVLTDPSDILRALVGLKDVRVLGFERRGAHVELVVEREIGVVSCPRCHVRARVKDRPRVSYVDLPVYGFPMKLTWKKHRLCCLNQGCSATSWMFEDHRIAAKGCLLTTRAAKWATRQVGYGRTVKEVAAELGCDWHTVNDAVTTYGAALLAADRQRVIHTSALGLDETNFVRFKDQRTSYATTVCDVEHHRIVDIVPTRRFEVVAGFLDHQPENWKAGIRVGTLDMSDAYAAVYSVILPRAAQVVDPFHVVKLANLALDTVRRRVQVQALGHRGRRDDPLYRARRLLLRAEERLSDPAASRLRHLLDLGDPHAEVAIAYRVKERVRDFYGTTDPTEARTMLQDLMDRCLMHAMPPEIQKFGRTLKKWFDKIVNFHLTRLSNGPTESINNLIKRIKRISVYRPSTLF